MTRSRFAFTPVPDKRLAEDADAWTPDDAVQMWENAARSRGMEPAVGKAIVVVCDVDGEINFIEGEVEA